MDNKTKKKAGTFQLNKTEAIHGWYSYVEGYSSCLVVNELDQLANENIRTIYDPFGGTGTTPLDAPCGVLTDTAIVNYLCYRRRNTVVDEVLYYADYKVEGEEYL